MASITSPHDHSSVKPPPSRDPIIEDIIDDSNSDEDEIDTTNNPSNFLTTNYDCILDPSFNPDFMEIVGT